MNYNIIFPTAFDSINPDNDNMDVLVHRIVHGTKFGK